MKFYIETIEQTLNDDALTEYGKTEKVDTEQAALTKFYKKLSDVAADIGKNHTYMDIKIVNSLGGCIKKDSIGEYVEESLAPEE
ncbi:MAG: hypothetical protein IIY21_05110 [Clostridiales bacterium]|nr:hypothetical protein [Clostridiales bacterium]